VPTHLDLDHAGGIGDFPGAAVHVFAPELRAALNPSSLMERSRYRAVQIAAVKKWAPVEADREAWFGFQAVRAIPGTLDEVLLVPLPGHTRGHCGVAARMSDGWLLHCGDAYFHHSEVAAVGGTAPPGLRLFERLVNADSVARRNNQARLRDLARSPGDVKLICSHDPADFATSRDEGRQALMSSRPVSATRPSERGDLRAKR
jgi:glyoxylase-like metal-dependent hydrolase (beta-lactamase superfamily II)